MSESSRDQHVQAILHSYLQAVDAGQTPDREEIVRAHPAFADDLRAFFADQAKMDSLAQSLHRGHALIGDLTLGADEAPASSVPHTLRYFGDYELQEEIARGGMGVVFKARQVSLNRPVALKMILKGELANATDVQRFRDEAEAAANLDHPNIVPIYEIGEHEGQQYFSMKLIGPGQRRADLGVKETVRITALVARAVHHAHQRGILHRDLKPGNILFDENGDPHVADFGLAKRVGGAGEESGTTRTGAIVGTPSYMAPEQARAEKVLTTAVDVYSVGAILYEWLTGQPPFRGDDVLATLSKVANDEPPRPRSLNGQIDRDLETICLKCLEKEPAKRFATADALADELDRYSAGEPILARPVGTPERLMRWCRRKPALAAASGLAALGVLLALVVFAGAFFVVSDALDSETTERKNAEKLAEDNKLLAEKEGKARVEEVKARLEADDRREQTEALALRIEFEHYFSKVDDRADLAVVGMASLLPRAVRLKDQSLADLLRLQLGAWSGRVGSLKAICDHQEGSVAAVALSADGKTALTGSYDWTARLWETATGKQIGRPLRHQGAVVAVALSADGKTALTGSHDKTAKLWERATGKQIGPAMQHPTWVEAVALSADGKTALTGSTLDGTARLWATATGKPIGQALRHNKHCVDAVALSADGKTALTGSHDGTARLWATATGKPIGPPLQHQGVIAVALSADGKTALTGSVLDRTARLWETATGKPIGPPLQHQEGVRAVALSADGKTALTGSMDNTARLWEAATGKPIGPPMHHQNQVIAVALSADAKTVLTGSVDATTRLWETATGQPNGLMLRHQDGVAAVALSGDGKTALTGSIDKTAQLWDTATGKATGPPLQHQNPVFKVVLSADGKTALTGSIDGTARLWKTATGKPIGPPLGQPLPQFQFGVPALALSADGKTALTASFDKTAKLWETATGKPIGPPLRHQDFVHAVALSADGKTALTGSGGLNDNTNIFFGEARLWETATGKPIGSPLQREWVSAVALSADGKTALTGSQDKTARLWETATGKPIGLPLQHQAELIGVALSADGKTGLTLCADKTARLWETATSKPIGPPLQHQGHIFAMALSANGKIALTGSEDNTAWLWETASGKPIGPPLHHQGAVRAVALSADGKTALTGSDDKTARLWHVPQPLRGDPERIMLWTQVITGLEVDELTAVHVLDAKTWQERKDRLQKLGGPPEQ